MKTSDVIHTLVAILEVNGDLDVLSTTQNACGDDQILAPACISIIELKDGSLAVDLTADEIVKTKPNPFTGLPL